jgi:hypothetical protein
MGKELVQIEPAFEPEVYEQPYELHVEARYDAYDDVLEADEAAIETSLDVADEEALEDGIASVFGTLRAEAEDGPTYALLAELNRIWAEPLAA